MTVVKKGIRFLLHPVTVFWIAVVTVFISGRYRPLWQQVQDPLGLFLGAAGGIVCYYGTLTLAQGKFPRVSDYLRCLGQSFTHTRPSVRKIIILGGRAIYEEAFWRGTLQVLLGNGIPALLAVALLFTGRHIYLYYGKHPLGTRILVEFFLFSLVVGTLYLISHRIMPVIGLHLVRNFLIAAGCTSQEQGGQ